MAEKCIDIAILREKIEDIIKLESKNNPNIPQECYPFTTPIKDESSIIAQLLMKYNIWDEILELQNGLKL